MTAFYGNPALKAQCIAQLEEHYRLDQIRQRVYGAWDDEHPEAFQGCHLGCLGHRQRNSDSWEGIHEKVARLWGFPLEMTHRMEWIFENLPPREAREFPLQQVRATPVGADLSEIEMRFSLVWVERPVFRKDSFAARDLFLALLRDAPVPVQEAAQDLEAARMLVCV